MRPSYVLFAYIGRFFPFLNNMCFQQSMTIKVLRVENSEFIDISTTVLDLVGNVSGVTQGNNIFSLMRFWYR